MAIVAIVCTSCLTEPRIDGSTDFLEVTLRLGALPRVPLFGSSLSHDSALGALGALALAGETYGH